MLEMGMLICQLDVYPKTAKRRLRIESRQIIIKVFRRAYRISWTELLGTRRQASLLPHGANTHSHTKHTLHFSFDSNSVQRTSTSYSTIPQAPTSSSPPILLPIRQGHFFGILSISKESTQGLTKWWARTTQRSNRNSCHWPQFVRRSSSEFTRIYAQFSSELACAPLKEEACVHGLHAREKSLWSHHLHGRLGSAIFDDRHHTSRSPYRVTRV